MRVPYRLAAASFFVLAVMPCSFDTTPAFLPRHVPEKFEKSFLAGKLGIIPVTLSARYKVIAWRYLAGLPLSAEEQKAVLDGPGPDNSSASDNDWGQALETAGVKAPFVSLGKQSRLDQNVFYFNCSSGAFASAIKTLNDRRTRYGNARLLNDWITSQNQVFENCGGVQPVYPADPEPAMTPLARADRVYQIAAAHFYAEDLEGAKSRFAEIEKDRNSPWRTTATYLIARTLIRENSLLHRQSALAEARAILTRVDDPALRDSAQDLIGYIDSLSDPAAAVKSLAAKLADPHPGAAFGATYRDGIYVLASERFRKVIESPDAPELFAWINAIEAKTPDAAISRWRRTPSTLWLTAAIIRADAKNPSAPDLIRAADMTSSDSPAFDTVTFHAIRLKIEAGRRDQARKQLDALLSGSPHDLDSFDNALRSERMSLATSFHDFLQWAQRRPIGYVDDYDGLPAPDPSFILGPDSAAILNRSTPAVKLAEAAESARLTEWPRTQIANVAWTRAFILNDDAIANRVIPVLAKTRPDWAQDLAVVQKATNEERRFADAFLIERHSEATTALQPEFRPTEKDDPLRQSWWCPQSADATAPQPMPPDAALSQSERAEAMRQWTRVNSAGATQTFLAPIVMNWAKAHPDDPRVPESLYRLVRITRYGCRGIDGNGAISKAAFDLLHSRYGSTTWAKQTPYWFP
ncbi:MAG TPA: hypothetical protein VKB79_21515 [Bryobacteraceae bacterium]|nr:hypothetical protein [Bryobacteraceae bacterium]